MQSACSAVVFRHGFVEERGGGGGGETSMDSALKGCWFESWSPLGEPVAIKDHPPARSIAFVRLKTELSIFFSIKGLWNTTI